MVRYKYTAFFKKNTTAFTIVVDTDFEKYEEMSDGLRKYYGYDNKTGLIEAWRDIAEDRRELKFDYKYFFFDFIQEASILDYLFIGSKATGLIKRNIRFLQDKCKEYLSYNDFSIDFFEKFTSSKRIFISRVLTQENATKLNLNAMPDEIGYRYESDDINAIVFACVHFALTNNYNKVMKCKHCERLFFTQTRKEEYCKRLSPCYGLMDSGTKVLREKSNCFEAVETIKKRFMSRKKVIYDKWYIEGDEGSCENLIRIYKKLMANFKETPNLDNILVLHQYLYSDEMPKQERPNRRKLNAEKRLLKDGGNNG